MVIFDNYSPQVFCEEPPLNFDFQSFIIKTERCYDEMIGKHLLKMGESNMKRVKAACICQTLHFMLKDGEEHLYAVKQVKDEVEKYKRDLERNHTQYKIVEQTEQSDGSIIVKVIKQYNSAPVGDYLN